MAIPWHALGSNALEGGKAGTPLPWAEPAALPCSVLCKVALQNHFKLKVTALNRLANPPPTVFLTAPETWLWAPSASKAYPPPLVQTGARFLKIRKHGFPCLDKPVFVHAAYHATHVACINPPYPSKGDTAKGYPSVACILIDRLGIEPLGDLAPHLEELNMLNSSRLIVRVLLMTTSPAAKREFFMTTQCGPTAQPTHQNTTVHAMANTTHTLTPTLTRPAAWFPRIGTPAHGSCSLFLTP